ncbi:MAG: SBBP repeat-containing protein [bacterium]
MKSILIIFLILNLNSGRLKSQLSQEWIRSYNGPVNGNDEALNHTIDNAGNVYAAGKIIGTATGFDIYCVKYNSSGYILWEKIYNGPGNGNDIAYSITLDNSGNVYVAGESKGINTNNDFILIKYNTDGDEQWNRRYNGESNSVDIPVKVVTDNSGYSIISGISWEMSSLFDIVTIKYNSDGVQQWIKRYNNSGNVNEVADDLAVDASGNIYVSGSSLGSGTLNDFVIIKYNINGDELWVNRYNGPVNGNDNMTSLTLDVAGNVIVTGTSVGAGTSLDFATIKYSPSGEEVWMKRYTTPTVNIEEPKAITNDADGNIYITGTTTGFSTSYDYMTVKYSAKGEEIWAKNYNGPSSFNFDEPGSVAVDNSGNVYVAGLSAGTGSMDDIVIVKYNSSGVESWVNRYNSPANRDDAARNITLDALGNIIVSGIITGAATGKDFAVIKFSQLTSVKITSRENPSDYSLSQNYPNPFNPSTKIKFDITQNERHKTQEVRLIVYDALGREVAALVNERLSTGSYEIEFNATAFASGVYFYKLRANDFSIVKRMTLLK